MTLQNDTAFAPAPTMLSRVREIIDRNTSTDIRGHVWVDSTQAALQILQLYEGDRWEDVCRGGRSVANGARLRELLDRWLRHADSGHWRDKAGLSLGAAPVADDTRAALAPRPEGKGE
jgi:hypothetical protein